MIRRAVAIIVFTFACAACGGGDDGGSPPPTDSTSGTEIVIAFEGGVPARDIWRQDVPLGDLVSVEVSGDRDEDIHIHGYDLYITPDEGDAALEFNALIPGRFEIELEESGRLILEITVS